MSSPLSPGTKLGRYEIRSPAGGVSFGKLAVWRATICQPPLRFIQTLVMHKARLISAPSTVALRKVSKNGGEPVMLDHGRAGWIQYITADKTQVYFTDIANVYALTK